ncbi:MAG: Holliday junction DNA helicase RuvB C-terminal domain-containing protein, partial [Fibrobacteria bacterium]
VIGETIVTRTLNMLAIDTHGLDEMDRNILKTIINKFEGGPVGLSTLGASLGEETETLEAVYEPYLIQCGFLKRTPRGRMATANAYRHLGLIPPAAGPTQEELI